MDEEYLFGGQKLTAREEAEFRSVSFLSLPWMIFLDCTWVFLQQEEVRCALFQVSEIILNLHFASDTRRRFMSLQQRVRRMLRMLKRYNCSITPGEHRFRVQGLSCSMGDKGYVCLDCWIACPFFCLCLLELTST